VGATAARIKRGGVTARRWLLETWRSRLTADPSHPRREPSLYKELVMSTPWRHLSSAIVTIALSLLAVGPAAAEDPAAPKQADPAAIEQVAKIRQEIGKLVQEDGFEAARKKLAELSKAFEEQHPQEPQRWMLRLMAAELHTAEEDDANRETARKLIEEISTAEDAPAAIREQASLLGVMRGGEDRFVEAASKHMQRFPQSRFNSFLARMVIGRAAGDQENEEAIAKLQPLSASPVEGIAAAARQRIDQIKTRIELKSKPLELKFTAIDGRTVDMKDLRGKVVLIDFWATWCGPCIAELPNVKAAYEKLHDKGFEIIGISLDSDREALEEFVKKREMPWPQQFDGKGWENELAQKFGIQAIPAMWLIGKDGKIADFSARGDLESKVQKLLGE
jgi:peroxiredoxin